MPRSRRCLLLPLLVALASLLTAAKGTPTAGKGALVHEISVRGNAKVEADAILTLLKTHKGEPLDPAAIKEDLKALYDLGYFYDVRVLKRAADGGQIDLVYQVTEKPAITSIA